MKRMLMAMLIMPLLALAGSDLYMVVDLSGGSTAESYTISYLEDVPEGGWTDEYKTTKLVLRRIEPGVCVVTNSNPYYAGVFEVTQKQYELITGATPSYFSGNDRCPVEQVSFVTLRGYNKGAEYPESTEVDSWSVMGKMRARTGLRFDLPTVAQWEYACRAGTTTKYSYGDSANGSYMWYLENSSYTTHDVGKRLPNPWGLYDVHGNVREWCLDLQLNYMATSHRKLRGGCYAYGAEACSSANSMGSNNPDGAISYDGFRMFCEAPVMVTDVKARQRYPWNGKVDISYFATGVEAKAKEVGLMPTLKVSAIDLATSTTNVATTLSGDASLADGTHKIVWDMDAQGLTLKSTNVVFTVVYEAVLPLYCEAVPTLYCIVDLSAGASATNYPVAYTNEIPSGGWSDEYKTTKLVLRKIKAGTFIMGSPTNELGRFSSYDLEAQHRVTLTKDYWMGVFPVTQRQWELVMGTRPSYYTNVAYYAARPVEQISYDMIRGSSAGASWPSSSVINATSFLGVLRAKSGVVFDLPTEAQWEYACRAGTTTALNSGKDLTSTDQDANMDKVGRYKYNGGKNGHDLPNCGLTAGTAKVGSYQPNAWGLYDMHGNVSEWCLDWFAKTYSGDETDPKGATSGGKSQQNRILRGGGFESSAEGCRSAHRGGNPPSSAYLTFGFRIAGTMSDGSSDSTKIEIGSNFASRSNPVSVDLTTGIRTSSGTEMLTFSTSWVDGAGDDSVAVVAVNDVAISENTGSGMVEWTPTEYGTNVLTHKVMIGGEQVGETLSAGFVYRKPDGGPYTETVDGIEWTFVVKNRVSLIGDGSDTAISETFEGALSMPTMLGGWSVAEINRAAFMDCDGITSVTIPSTVKVIDDSAFIFCDGLTSVTIPEGVTTIGYNALGYCNGLVSVTLPSSVTNMDSEVFSFDSALMQFSVSADNPKYKSVNGLLLSKDGKILLAGVNGDVTIPEGVTCIDGAFYGYNGLTGVTIPSSVERIGYSTFSYCHSLTNVTISEGVGSIGECAFEKCGVLTSVAIPSSVTNIGASAFEECSGLTNVIFSGNAPKVDADVFGAFSGVDPMCIATVYAGTQGWDDDGDGKWQGLILQYRPRSDGGPYTETVDGIEWTYTVSGGKANVGNGYHATAIPSSTTGVVAIPSALGGCPVAIVGYCAFRGCCQMTHVTIPTSVMGIASYAFENCSGLTSISIPPDVTILGGNEFVGCDSLKSIYFEGNAPKVGTYFSYLEGCIAYVKKGSTGWNVCIPGVWYDINIAYYTAYEVESAGEIKIHDDWVEKYAPGKSEAEVTELLAQPAANGKYKNWECYVLGLDPTNENSKLVLSAPQSQDSDTISVALNVNVPAGCGYTVSNEVTVVGGSGGHVVTALPNGFTIDLTGSDDPSGLYTIKVKLVPDGSSTSTSEIEVEQTVGVRKSTSELTKTAIAVPWGELTGKGAQSICVSNIVKTANLTAGDKLHVYNTASSAYETWQLSANRTWEPLATYVILEDGSVSTTSAGAPTTTMISRGSAVWLERQDTSKPFYLYGEYQSGTIETSIVGGTTATPVWNFVAPPTLEGFDLNNITGASENDKIVVTTANGPKVYTYKGGAWGSDVNTTVTRTLPGGGTIDVVKKTRDTSNTTIAAGTGFMYVSQGGAPTIQW